MCLRDWCMKNRNCDEGVLELILSHPEPSLCCLLRIWRSIFFINEVSIIWFYLFSAQGFKCGSDWTRVVFRWDQIQGRYCLIKSYPQKWVIHDVWLHHLHLQLEKLGAEFVICPQLPLGQDSAPVDVDELSWKLPDLGIHLLVSAK